MGILQTVINIANEAKVAIGVVIGAIILGAFAWHWAKSRFTLASAITGLISAGLVGWAAAAGIAWFSEQLEGTIDSNSVALVDVASVLTTLV